MKRRSFVAWIGGAAATWPLAPRAQRAIPVLGFLNSAAPENYTFNARAFRDGLAEAVYAEGRNLAVEYRWAHDDYARLPALAAAPPIHATNDRRFIGPPAGRSRAGSSRRGDHPLIRPTGAIPRRPAGVRHRKHGRATSDEGGARRARAPSRPRPSPNHRAHRSPTPDVRPVVRPPCRPPR